MGYWRFIKTTHSPDLYQLAIMADFAEMTYSVVMYHTNRTHTILESHIIASFPNIFDATREYNRLVADRHKQQDCFKCWFHEAKEKSKLYV